MAHQARPHPVRRFVLAACLVLAGMAGACVLGYLSRSPLGSSESLLTLMDFDALFVARCPSVEALCERLRSLPRYEELRSAGLLSSTALARVAERIDRKGRVLGVSILDVFDVFGDEVVVAEARLPDGGRALLCASRVRPAASLALGAYAAVARPARLPTAAGDWWAMVEKKPGRIWWTTVGDVLAASTNPGLLAGFVTSARRRAGPPPPLVAALPGGQTPEVALRPRAFVGSGEAPAHDPLPRACVFSVHVGIPRDRAPAPAGFGKLACSYLPAETCGGWVARRRPEAAWRLLLGSLSEDEGEKAARYVEDELCAILDVDDFREDLLGWMTGDFAQAVSDQADPWLRLASAASAPTLSTVLQVRSDAAIERRLPYVLEDAAVRANEAEQGFEAQRSKIVHRGQVIHTLEMTRVHRNGVRESATAGFFIAPVVGKEGARTEHSVVVASTSAAWLKRAIDAREGTDALGEQEWFGGLSGAGGSGRSVFAFVHGDRASEILERMEEAGARDWAAGRRWVRLLGAVSVDGEIGADGVLRGAVRIPGRRLGPGAR